MGGYNTFCEILSFDKRALIVPRTAPRMEQYIRAARAQELGLVSMLLDDEQRDPHIMATALRQLPQQQLPSQVVVPGLLDGDINVNRLADQLLARGRQASVAGASPIALAARASQPASTPGRARPWRAFAAAARACIS